MPTFLAEVKGDLSGIAMAGSPTSKMHEIFAAQLNNRIQHKLNAFTPRDQAAVRAAATTFRANPDVDVATVITELKIGEALVSLLQPDGSPTPVQRTLIAPPGSRVGPITPDERTVMIQTDAIGDTYDEAIDRESAEEILTAKAGEAQAAAAASKAGTEAAKAAALQAKLDAQTAKAEAQAALATARVKAQADAAATREAARVAREAAKPSLADKMVQSAARSVASSVGRQVAGKLGSQLLRGILGGLFKGR